MCPQSQIASWQELDPTSLDLAYNNSAAVEGSADIVDSWEFRGQLVRARGTRVTELQYGPRARNRIDFISAGDSAPVFVFFHGGYWQARSKDTFTFLSEGLLPLGISIALVGYTLCPEASLDTIVSECRTALAYLDETLPSLGVGDRKLTIGGWSAGAHLAAMLLDHPSVGAALLISGIYDLEPIINTYINDKLRLDHAGAMRNSPQALTLESYPPTWIIAGAKELPELRRQSRDFAQRLKNGGHTFFHSELGNTNHFTIMEAIADPQGALAVLLQNEVMQA